MELIKKELQISRSAQYCESKEQNLAAPEILFVLHGYGHLAEFFIQKFKDQDLKKFRIVAPEALSRFYTNGATGRVGASWMTKQNRHQEISDYCKYLENLLEIILKSHKATANVSVLGFSQGAATAARFVASSQFKINNLILWSGMLAQDLSDHDIIKISQSRLFSVYGVQDKDPYINQLAIDAQKLTFAARNLKVEEFQFDGGHELPPEIIRNILDKL